jgi:tRNA G10  N-methylase Trm11
MDYQMIGSDSSERMIRATNKNLHWLAGHFSVDSALQPNIFNHQADTKWSKRWVESVDAVVTEPFLGKPVKRPLPADEVARRMNALGELYHRVFRAFRPVLKPGGDVVFALPAWRAREGWTLFPEVFLDAIAGLGYSKHQLGNEARGTLLYARPDALVARELTVWHKIVPTTNY